MARIEGVCREVCDATEYVTIVTQGPDGPHLAGHWGSYMRIVDPGATVVFPVGRFQRTEQNLKANGRIQLMVASHKVAGTRSPGQGCVIAGSGELVTAGEHVGLPGACSRVVQVARKAKGNCLSLRFSARWTWMRPTRFQAGWRAFR